MNLKCLLCLILLTLNVKTASAGYDANITGVVTNVLTYTHADQVYFRIDNQPSTHPKCKVTYFSIDASIPPERRAQVLSRLLTAHASGKPVNIGYDKTGDCSHGWIRAYRVG